MFNFIIPLEHLFIINFEVLNFGTCIWYLCLYFLINICARLIIHIIDQHDTPLKTRLLYFNSTFLV